MDDRLGLINKPPKRVPSRIEEVVNKVRQVANERNSSPEIVEAIYRAMIEINIELERKNISEREQKK